MKIIEREESKSHVKKIAQWWLYILSRNRLFFSLMREDTNVLMNLPYLDIILRKLDHDYRYMMRVDDPPFLHPFRDLLLSAKRNYIYYLRSIKAKQFHKADMYYNLASADMSALQFMLLERGIKSPMS